MRADLSFNAVPLASANHRLVRLLYEVMRWLSGQGLTLSESEHLIMCRMELPLCLRGPGVLLSQHHSAGATEPSQDCHLNNVLARPVTLLIEMSFHLHSDNDRGNLEYIAN